MKILIYIFCFLILFSCNKNEITEKDKADYNKAYAFLIVQKKDSAFKYFNRAKDNFIKEEYFSHAGSCLVNMAIIQCDDGDFYGSQETGLSAIKYLNEKEDAAELSSNYNNLGIAFQNLKDYTKAAKFYDKATKFSKDTVRLLQINNKAVSFNYLKKYDSAISIFKKILSSTDVKKHPLVYAKAYDNLAYTKFLQNPNYNAETELIEALAIRTKINDVLGQNASFSHLTEYFEKKNPQKALFFAREMLRVASLNKSADDKISALKKIIFLETSENIKPLFIRHQMLSDSLNTERNKSKNQFAFERFDSEKLKTENAEKEVGLIRRNIGLTALFLLLIGGFFLYKRRKKRLQQENELKIKNNQLKLSKKVHDVVANGIYQVMAKIENQENIDKNEMLDELEFVYEKSRDISYEKIDSKEEEEDFSKKISELIASFKNESINTYVAGNDKTIWKDLKISTQEEVYQIVRELLVNMKKHSQADRVVFKFERINNFITISYTDNGIGISGELIYKNGLTSTVSRIENIHGEIIFDTEIEKGLKITISFPI